MQQSSKPTTPTLLKGRVLWFNEQKGFGFLRPICCGGAAAEDIPGKKRFRCLGCGTEHSDVFVHYSAIVGGSPGHRNLNQDQRVEFEQVAGDKGPAAHNVRVTT